MRKKTFWLIIIISIQLLTGCWNQTELNQIAVVLAVAVDKTENKEVRMTMQITSPNVGNLTGSSEGGETQKSTITVSETGKSMIEVYRKILKKISKKVIFSHSQIIIIGEEIAREGFSSTIDFFWAHTGFSLRSFVVFTKGKAGDLLKITPSIEPSSAEEIKQLEILNIGLNITFRELLNVLASEGIEPTAAQIGIKPLEEKNKGGDIVIIGTAIFHKDKLIGWMNQEETSDALLLFNKNKTEIIRVLISEEKGGGDIGVIIDESKTKINPVFSSDDVKIEIAIDARVSIMPNNSKLDLSSPKTLQFLQNEIEANIKKRVQLLVKKVQNEWESDIFGFGASIYRKDPKKWETQFKPYWDKKFSKIDFNIVQRIKIYNVSNNYKTIKSLDDK